MTTRLAGAAGVAVGVAVTSADQRLSLRLIPSSHQELLARTRNQCTVSLASRWTVVLSRPSPQSIVSEVSNTVFCRSSLYASASVRHWTVYSVAPTTSSKHTATRPSQAVTSMFAGTPSGVGVPVAVSDQPLSPPALAACTRSV